MIGECELHWRCTISLNYCSHSFTNTVVCGSRVCKMKSFCCLIQIPKNDFTDYAINQT